MTSPKRFGAALALLALTLAACVQSGRGSSRLEVRAPGWTLVGRPLVMEARTRGALAVRDVTLTVLVGIKVVGRWSTHSGQARIEIPPELVPAGYQKLTVKTGTESVTLRVRVVPLWQAASALMLLLGVLWLSVRFALRRPSERRASR